MKLVINGKTQQIECVGYLNEIRQMFFPTADVMILNGYQTAENLALKDGDTIALLKKGEPPKKQELESIMLSRHTPFVHEKVKKANVAVAGLGGLGSNIAIMLARTGIGKLLLVDFDVVEPSNLNRQSYYIRHLGLEKTKAMTEQIKEINPFIEIDTVNERVTSENCVALFHDYEIVCEAFDNPESKSMLVNELLICCPNVKIVAASGMAGFESANAIQTKKSMGRLYVCGDLKSEAAVGNGLMAPRVSVCAGHQANMVLRLIVGEMEP